MQKGLRVSLLVHESFSGNGKSRIARCSGLHFADVDVNWVQRVACIDSELRCHQ